MPKLPDLVTQRHFRLLTFAGLAIAGAVCPVAAVSTVVTGIAGGVVATDAIAHHLSRLSVKLRRSKDSLANEDIIKASGLAVGLLINSVAESGKYPQDTKKLEKLALYAAQEWPELIRQGKLPELEEEKIIDIFAKQGNDFFKQEVLEETEWQEVIQQEFCQPHQMVLEPATMTEVVTTLKGFPKALREVLKTDFKEEGKAFAGLTLSMLGEMLAILKQRIPQGNAPDLQPVLAAVAEVEARQQQLSKAQGEDLAAIKSQQELVDQRNKAGFRDLGQEIDSGFEAVMTALGLQREQIQDLQNWLQGELQQISQQLKEIKDDTGAIKIDTTEIKGDTQEIKEQLERIEGFFQSRQESRVQAISYVLDTNPVAVTNWQGREQDLATVNGWLDDENSKLGIIVGIGGMGKSTLAAKVFRDRTDDFKEKLWIDLGQRPKFLLVAKGIIDKFGKPSPEQLEQIEKLDEANLIQVLINVLGQERFLLVWDNFETVLEDDGYGQFLQQWLGKCHNSEILITTQEVPNLGQEKPDELALPGLTDEAGGQLLADLKVGGSRQELAEFSNRVNGHPLTLRAVAGLLTNEIGDGAALGELAGMGLLDLGQLLPRLQKTHRQEVYLVAVLGISFGRLAPELQRVLLSLVVFRRSFDAGVAAAISGEVVTEKDLRGLGKRGFLIAEGKGSYTFQPFILEYLKYKAGDLTTAHRKAIDFYQDRFKPRDEWQTVDDVQEYLEVFYHLCQLGEYPAAFDVICNGTGVDDVNDFLSLRGNNQIRVEIHQQLINNLTDKQDSRYFASLISLGNAYAFLGSYQNAIDYHQKSRIVAQNRGNKLGEVISLIGLGGDYYFLELYQEAIDFYQQSLEIAQRIGYIRGEASSLIGLGNIYSSRRSYKEARKFYRQSLVCNRKIGDKRGEANSLGNLGGSCNALGKYKKAIIHIENALEIDKQIGDRRGESISLRNLGNTYDALGEYQKAIEYHQQSLLITQDIKHRKGESNALIGLGNAHYSLRYYQEAINYYHLSLEITLEIGDEEGEYISLGGLGNAYNSLGYYRKAVFYYGESLKVERESKNRQEVANTLFTIGILCIIVGDFQKGITAFKQATAIYQELGLPLDIYPFPNWIKKLIKFAQSSKFKFILCIILGIFAFPFVLVGFLLLTLYRLLRSRP